MYKYEMHCHDNVCSRCAHSTPEEMVAAYYKAGYKGLTFTNHFLRGNTAVDKTLPWADKMKWYYNAYLRGKNSIDDSKFHVFFGLEHNYGNGKEVLTYGITLEFLLANPGIDQLPLSEYSRLVRQAGGWISQAHPFREAGYINPDVTPEAESLDGLECYNFCNTDEENLAAYTFAKEKGLYMTSGGDTHEDDYIGIGQAGMAFDHEIKTSAELVQALKNHEGKMIVGGLIK